MAEPLLARRPESQASTENGDEDIEEEDALLTGERTGKVQRTTQQTRSKWREIGLFVWAVVATAAVVVLGVVYQHGQSEGQGQGQAPKAPSGKRNLVFMISDGMGPTDLTLTRTWQQYVQHLPYDRTLFLDDYLIGQSRTRSTSSLVTDSAAGATAFSCGEKSYNGAISVLPDFQPCGSVMEAAKRKGYKTGLVVTTRITDATPAVWVSHARRRSTEDNIAMQMIGETHPMGRMVDLMFGGGSCHFLPNMTEGSCRDDDLNVIDVAKGKGWNYIDSRKQFDDLHQGFSANLPLMALFAPRDFPYEIDRRSQSSIYPSLAEMTKTALRALSAATKDSEQGFFIMIEGSRIDHAGHANDPAAQVHEVLAYDRAMSAVMDFIKEDQDSGTPTLMVATSDHETGGLSVARQLNDAYPRYLWYPGVLANVSFSASHTSHRYQAYLNKFPKHAESGVGANKEDTKAYLAELSREALGIGDSDDDELENLVNQPLRATYFFADMISRRAQTGWSTHGHSGADVNVYSSDAETAKDLIGNHENTDIGAFFRSYLGLEDEVEAVTKELREHMSIAGESWLGRIPEEDERLDGQDHLDHYYGDHKLKRCETCGM